MRTALTSKAPSATRRQGLGPLWQAIAQAHKSATRKMSTPVLTRLLLEAAGKPISETWLYRWTP